MTTVNKVYGYVLNDVYAKISKELKDKYITLVLGEEIIDINPEEVQLVEGIYKDYLEQQDLIKKYIEQIINSELWETKSDEIIRVKRVTYDNRTKTKARWVSGIKKELKDYSIDVSKVNEFSITGELEIAKKNLKLYGVSKFKDIYEVNSIEELIKLRLKQIDNWKKNQDIVSFPYIASKQGYQINNAINLDFLYRIVEIAVLEYDSNFKSAVTERPSTLDMYPFFSAESNGEVLEVERYEQLSFNDYDVNNNFTLRTIIDKNKEGALILDKLYSFDHRDSILLDYLFTKKDEQFISKKLVQADIGEIVKNVYKSRSADCYAEVEQRILKIANYKMQGIIKEKDVEDTVFVLNLFEKAYIRTDPISKKRYATIILSDTLHQEMIEGSVSLYYYRQVKLLENPTSKVIIYPLQKERLEHCTETESYKGFYDYGFFRQHIRFRSKRKATNLNIIELSLEEFKEKKFIVNDYIRKPDGFEIEFTTIPQYEMEDLMKKSIINRKNFLLEGV